MKLQRSSQSRRASESKGSIGGDVGAIEKHTKGIEKILLEKKCGIREL